VRPFIAAAFLLAAVSALAEEPGEGVPAPAKVDEAPSAFACTFEHLTQSRRCVFEWKGNHPADKAEQARDNVRIAAASGKEACAEASRAEGEFVSQESVQSACEKRFAVIARQACSLQGETAIADENGNLAAAAQPCFTALAEVLSRARSSSGLSNKCCSCLASAKCPIDADHCSNDLLDGRTPDAAQVCMQKVCSSECSLFSAPAPQQADPQPPAAPARKTKKSRAPTNASADARNPQHI
jgi:hypothetical protein